MRRTLSIALAAVLGVLVFAVPAAADDTTGVPAAKAAVTHRIDLRLAALARFNASISGARNLTADHRSTLQTLVSQDQSGLTSLKTKVAGETTLAALKADAQSMINDYRIFILVGPKVRLTAAGDAEDAANARLRTAHDKLADLVAKAKAAGHDTTQAEADLADMSAQLDKAASAGNGQVAALLAIQPGPDGAAIKSQVDGVRAALVSARGDLRAAIADAKKVRDFLKSLKNT
jgi:hypothetical protein